MHTNSGEGPVAPTRGPHRPLLRGVQVAISLAVVVGIFAWFCGPAPNGPDLPVLRHLPVLVKGYQRERVRAMFSSDPQIQGAAP